MPAYSLRALATGIHAGLLPLVRLAQHEGAGELRSVALDLRRQVDGDKIPALDGSGLWRPCSMQDSTPTLTHTGVLVFSAPARIIVYSASRDDLVRRDALAEQLPARIHAQPGDALGLGHERQLALVLDGADGVQTGSDVTARAAG